MVHVSETCEPPHPPAHAGTRPNTVYEAQCTEPIHEALSEKDMAPLEHSSMAPISARHCSPRAGTSTVSRGAAPRGRSKLASPYRRGVRSPAVHGRLGSGRRAVPKARSRPCGGSIAIGRASRIPWSASASRTAGPVTPGPLLPDHGPRAPSSSPVAGALEALQAARTWYASEEGRQRLPMSCGSRRHPGARRAGLWPATDPLSGLREDPLAARGHRRRDQYRPDCRLAGGASTGDDPDLALCGTGACTRPARGDFPPSEPRTHSSPQFLRSVWAYFYFYYKNYFSHTQSREAYLEGAPVFYEG